MYTGGCYCGVVKFEIQSAIEHIVFCHCSECRKLQGSAFASNGVVDKSKFKLISGEKDLSVHKLSDYQTRYFCKHCGSPIKSENSKLPNKVRVRLGTINNDLVESPQAHIFVGSKANWDYISDALPQFDTYEEERL